MTTITEEVDLAEWRLNNKSGVGVVGWQSQDSEGYWTEVAPDIVGTLRSGGVPVRPVYAIAPERQRDIAVEALRVAEANMFNVAIALASGGTKVQANKDLHAGIDRCRAALKACGVSE